MARDTDRCPRAPLGRAPPPPRAQSDGLSAPRPSASLEPLSRGDRLAHDRITRSPAPAARAEPREPSAAPPRPARSPMIRFGDVPTTPALGPPAIGPTTHGADARSPRPATRDARPLQRAPAPTAPAAAPAVFGAVRAATLYDLGGGVIQRVIRVDEGAQDLTAVQARAALAPLLHPAIRGADSTEVDQVLQTFDADGRRFDDLADLAVAVETEVRARVADTPGVLVSDELAEVLLDVDFRAMIGGAALPAAAQQGLGRALMGEIDALTVLYRGLARTVQTGARSPETILKEFTADTRQFAARVVGLVQAFFGAPTAPLEILIAGSGARQEMFPGSDLDLAAVTQTSNQAQIIEVFEFMQRVEKALQVIVRRVSHALGSDGEVGLGPDTGVFGFKSTPEQLAASALDMNNTAQDADPLAGPGGLTRRFFQQRNALGTEQHALSSLRDLLVEFQPPAAIAGRMDIKKAFLRLPTLALRDVAQALGLRAVNSFDRVRELVDQGFLDGGFGRALLDAMNVISGIRLKLHVFYGKEKDTFAVAHADAQAGDYVLDGMELHELQAILPVLATLHVRLGKFLAARRNAGFFTSRKIPS